MRLREVVGSTPWLHRMRDPSPDPTRTPACFPAALQLLAGGRHLPSPERGAAGGECRGINAPLPWPSAPASSNYQHSAFLLPQSEEARHFFQRVEQCSPLWAALQRTCR